MEAAPKTCAAVAVVVVVAAGDDDAVRQSCGVHRLRPRCIDPLFEWFDRCRWRYSFVFAVDAGACGVAFAGVFVD